MAIDQAPALALREITDCQSNFAHGDGDELTPSPWLILEASMHISEGFKTVTPYVVVLSKP